VAWPFHPLSIAFVGYWRYVCWALVDAILIFDDNYAVDDGAKMDANSNRFNLSEDEREGVGSKISKKQKDGLRFLVLILLRE